MAFCCHDISGNSGIVKLLLGGGVGDGISVPDNPLRNGKAGSAIHQIQMDWRGAMAVDASGAERISALDNAQLAKL